MEKKLEVYFKRRLEKLGYKCIKFRSPGNNGWPDRLVIGPNGFLAFVEMKDGKKYDLDPLQVSTINSLKRMGHLALAIRSKDDIENFIAVYL